MAPLLLALLGRARAGRLAVSARLVVGLLTLAGVSMYAIGGGRGDAAADGAADPADAPRMQARLPAFPGAEGFGAYTVGGRGGKVCEVTNLDDSGPGSLRAAVEAQGSRIVVFRVSGTIRLQSSLDIENPCITIAGQTAPGGGICLRDYTLRVETHDVVIRYLRCRLGDATRQASDSITLSDARNVIIDHCSASWSIDETLSVTRADTDNVTVQWTIIAESLNRSYHDKGPHGYGSIIGGRIGAKGGGITFHHNLYAHHNSRNPRLSGDKDAVPPGPAIDFRNNVIYDWGNTCGYSVAPEHSRSNYVGNYLRPGPSTHPESRKTAFNTGGAQTSLYVVDNHMAGYPEADADNWLMINAAKGVTRLDEPVAVPPVATHDAPTAYRRVLDEVGAVLPKRDAADRRLIDEVRNGTGHIINSQTEVGGWPELAAADPLPDRDHDGMPDDWERKHGLDPDDPSDGPKDADGDGYTNVEEYLNATEPSEPEA